MESTNNQNVRSENDQPLGKSITTGPNSSSSARVAVPEPTDTKPFNPNSVSSTPLPNYPNVENSVGIDFSRDYDFKQVKDLLPTLDENAFKQIDPDYMAYLGAVENELSKYVPPVVSNINSTLPGRATNNYNPVAQALPTRSSSSRTQPSSFGSAFQAAMGRVSQQPSSNKSLIGHVSPTYFSAKAAAFDRYYKHPKFNELGFHPYVNNEAYYNANSTILDDGVRMFGQAANQFGSAFISTYRSIGDLFDEDNYWTGKDLKTAGEFMSATEIGMSSRGGVGGFVNNLVLNSAYTFGIISNIVVEDIALNYLTGGGKSGMTFATIGTKLKNLGKGIAGMAKVGAKVPDYFSISKAAGASTRMLERLGDINVARGFYNTVKAGGKLAANIFTPHTIAGIRKTRTAANAADGAANIAKGSNVFFDMYKDFRELNFALGEAKLEGGIVYQEQFTTALAKIMEREGVNAPTEEMMAEARENAAKASFYTTILNAPFIYLSNKVVLGTMLKGFKGNRFLRETFEEGSGILKKRVVRSSASRSAKAGKKAGETAGKAGPVFEDVGEGLFSGFRRMRALGAKGTARQFAQGSLRYFAANITEGTQELYQEAVSAGTQDYYSSLASDPTMPSHLAFNAAFANGIGSQISAEGFHTFLSGFFMGGIVQGPQKFLTSTIPNLYKTRIAKDEEYLALKDRKDEYVEKAVASLNEMTEIYGEESAVDIFSLKKLRINGINEAAKGQVEDEMNGDILSYFNKEDFKRFQMINDKVSNGSADLLLEHFNELDTLSDEDLAGYFGEENTAENAKKLRSRLSEVKGDIQAVKDAYEQSNLDLVNPFENFAQFKKGSKEYSDAFGKYVAFEHARYLYVYTKDTFRKSTKRFNDIFKSLESDPILANLQASDLTVLLDPKATKNEITILKKEIASMEGSEEFAEEIEFKRKKIKALEAFVEILQDPANLKDDETFDTRLEYAKKLRPAFLEYVQLLADSRDDFVNRDVINETLQKIVDYGYLKGSAIQYNKALEVLLNPQVLSDLTERMAKLNPYDKAQREKFVKGVLEKYIDNENVNAFFNELFELGVTTDPMETVDFMRTGDIEKLTLFYTDAGQVNPIDDFELQTKIDFAKGQFKKIQEALNPKEESDQTAETKERVESKADEILKELGFTVYEQLELTNEDPYLNRLILAKHRQYQQKEKALGREPLELNDWLASPNLGGKVVTAFEIARQIFANRIAKKELSNEMLEGINVDNLEKMLADVEAGTNFEKWLNSPDTLNDEGLINALEAADSSYNDLLTLPKISSPIQQNNVASVSEVIVFDANGNKQVTYTLNDAQGNPLTADQLDALDIKNNAGIFLDKSSALRAFNKYSQSIEDTTAWEFAGEEIYHGAVIIERSTGKRFVVLSTPQMKDSSSVLKIVPEEFADASNKVKNRKSKVITTSDFDSYAKEGVNINIAPEDTAKLSALDFISIYPKNEIGYLEELLQLSDENITGRFGQKNSQDNANKIRSRISERIIEIKKDKLTEQQRRQKNKQRLNVIFKSLTQEELSQLSLEIKINDQGVNKPYQIEVLDSNGNKVVKSNPQIRRTGEGYSVQVRVMNASLQKRINEILNDAGLSPIDFTFDNGIAFLPNGGYKFFNDRNVEVDPRTMDQYTANQIFTENTSDLKGIQEKFAINAALSAALSGKRDGIYTIKQLGEDFRFAIDVSLNFSENKNRIKFSDIEYGNLTVGGKTVVVRQKGSQMKFLTNLTEFKDVTARDEFISKLRNEIKGQFRDNMIGMGEYMLLLRLPDGQLRYIPFDRRPISDEQLSDVVQYAMNESVRLRENKKKLSAADLRKEVDKVNKEIKRRLYTSSNKKDSSIFINIELNPFTDSYKFGFIQIKGKQDIKGKPGSIREMGADSSTMTELYNKKPLQFLTGLINAANNNKKFTDLVGELSRDSFYAQTPRFDKDTSTATEALENQGLTTGVEPTVFKFSGPFIRNNGTTTQAVRNTPLAASNTKVDSAPAPKADPVPSTTKSAEVTPEQTTPATEKQKAGYNKRIEKGIRDANKATTTKEKAKALQTIITNTTAIQERHGESFVTDEQQAEIDRLTQELANEGAQISENVQKGKEVGDGQIIDVEIRNEDDTLPIGTTVIERVMTPELLDSDGNLVQKGKVKVRVGTRKLTQAESNAKIAEIEAKREKALNTMQEQFHESINEDADADIAEVRKNTEAAPTQQAAPTQGITEYKPMDTTGRDVLYLQPFNENTLESSGTTFQKETRHTLFKLILDKNNPNEGTLEISSDPEKVKELRDKWVMYFGPQLVKYDPLSDFDNENGRIVIFKPGRVKKQGNNWLLTEKFEAEMTGASKVSKVLAQQAAPTQQAAPVTEQVKNEAAKEAFTRNELLQQLQSINNQIEKRKIALVNAKVPADKRDNDPELLRLYEELSKIDNELNPGTANKLVDGSLSYSDITAIDEFVEWAKTNLPDFISISDINELGSNLKKGGVRVGAFIMSLKGIGQGVEGNIYTGASNPFKYHEAFHAVFRMLLTDTQIEQYLKIGKKELLAKLKSEGKTLKGEMQRLKNSAAIYEGMSDARLEQELIEEYLADRFEEFKTDRKGTQTDSIIKAFFNRLMEIIRSVFKQYSPRQLETLFQKIDAGKFKDSSVQQNRYTESTFGNVSLEADKLIPVEKVSRSTRYLDSTTAKQLIADMSGYYIRKFSEAVAPIDKNQILDEVIEDFTKIYDPISDNNDNLEEYQLLALFDINKALRTFSSEVKDGITEYLDLVTVKVADRLEELEENFDEEGDRTVQDWDKSQELIGGYGSLSEYVRKYIATTTMSATDIFGREMTMPDGRPYATTVDAFTAYSGMVKAARNTSDQFEMLRKMVKYSKYNPQTAAVINRFLNDVGISEEELMSSDQPVKITGDGNLFQRFMAAFENYTVDYKIVDNLSGNNRVKIYSALNANNASLQLSKWGNNYVILKKQFRLDPQFKQDAIDDLNEIAEFFNPVETITDELLSKRALQISIALSEKVGVMVNPLYVEFSLLQNVNSKTKEQAKFLNDNADAKPMTSIDVGQMANTIEQDKFLFKRSEGILSRLENIAQGNAVFDENILLSQFRDANGNLVNAHQAATFHLKKVYELNKAGVLEDMQSDLSLQENPILKNNPILSNPLIGELAAQNGFKVTRINGRLEYSQKGKVESTTYGDYNSEQFLSDIVAAYFSNVEPNTGNVKVIEDSQGNKQALADTLIRVMEASNTGDLVTLPIIKTIDDNGKITKQTVEIFKNRIENEFDRIKQLHLSAVTNEITSVIEGYNTTYKNDEGDIQFEGRGFRFFNNGMYMGSELQSSLEGVFKGKSAEELADLTLETALKEVNSSVAKLNTSISKSLNSQYASWRATVLLENLPAQVYKGAMSESGFVNQSSNDLLNLKSNDGDHNLKQIFLSDLINTEAINEILLGDQAVSTKDAVDKVKRAKMQNAAGKSAAHLTVDAKLGINHTMTKMRYIQFEEPTIGSIYNGEDIDRADAQSYYTVDGFIHTFFGFGKLSQQQADVAMKIKQGIDITREELFGAADKEGLDKLQGMFNSKKIVYGDGQVYIKTSAFMLTPQFTSTKESGYTEAIPGMEQLHNLRLIMERFEAESMTDSEGNDTGEIIPVIASPISASKMKKENVNPLDVVSDFSRFDEVKSVEIDADFMRLQVINPSNKGAVTDPTQIKTLISSELLTKDSESKTIKKINIAGQELSLKEIKDEYHKKQNAKVRLNFRGRRNLIINFSVADAFSELNKAKKTGKVSVNLYAMLKFAEKSNKASNLSSNMLEIFSVENGEAKYDPNMPISIDKFEQIFLNFFSNAINAKLNGDKFTLVSDYGHYVYRRVFSVDQNGNPDRSEVIRRSIATKQGLEPINKSTPGNISMLAEAIEKAGGEGVVILDRLRPNVKEYDENGKFTGRIFSEVTIPAQSGEVYEHLDMKGVEIPSVVSEFFSTRIPTQDKHSASAARVVDFMPAFYGSVAMFPAELIQVSGSDFDVDAVYAHFKQYFEVDGKFYEYGKATNDKGRFFEYQRFLNEEVNKKGSTLNLALALYQENAAQIEIAKTGTEEFDLNFEAVTKMISEIEESYTSKKTRGLFSKDAFVAAAMIGMPVSFEQFQAYEKKYGETPSEAELNNRILDIKIGLLANEYTSDKSATPDENGNMISIAHEAASLKTLKSVLQTLSDKHAQIRDRISEENVNVNSLDGKTSSFKNNKEGAGLIGNAVIPNNILSLLSEFNAELKLPIIIDGVQYDNFNEQFQKGTTERTQVIVDELITAATDNAKERLITKLSLTKGNIAIAVAMAKLGISPTFIFEFLGTPFVSGVFNMMARDNIRFETAYKKLFKTLPSELSTTINSKVINDNYTSRKPTPELMSFLYGMHILSQEVLQSIAPLSLTKNLGRDLSNIDRVLEALEEMDSTSKKPAEQNKFIKGSKHFSDSFYESYIESVKEISEIADSVFVQRTQKGKEVTNLINATVSPFLTADQKLKIKRDVVSYLTLSQYMLGYSQARASLSNDFLYGTGEFTPADVVNRLREYSDQQSEENFFLDVFLRVQEITDEENTSGISIIQGNTLIQLTDAQKVDLQNDFMRLYDNPVTRVDAMHLVHYLMVKDALQYQYGGILDAIPVAVLGEFNQAVIDASQNPSSEQYVDFRRYFASASAAEYLQKIYDPLEKGIQIKDDGKTAIVSYSYASKNEATIRRIENAEKYLTPPIALNIVIKNQDTFYALKEYIPGKYAVYTRFQGRGSLDHNPIGFIFDGQNPRPTLSSIDAQVNKANNQPVEPTPAPTDIDAAVAAKLEGLQDPNNNVIVDGKNLTIEKPSEQPTTQPQAGVKEGVSELFESNSELASIGTPEQYSAYLDTIFPDSKVKDIVYHGSYTKIDEFLREFLGKNTRAESAKKGFFFSSSFKNSLRYVEDILKQDRAIAFDGKVYIDLNKVSREVQSEFYSKMGEFTDDFNGIIVDSSIINNLPSEVKTLPIFTIGIEGIDGRIRPYSSEILTYEDADWRLGQLGNFQIDFADSGKSFEDFAKEYVHSVIINAQNPLVTSDNNKEYREDSYSNRLDKTISENKDSLIIEDTKDPLSTDVLVVLEPEQTHILGNKKDIQGFKEFVAKSTTQPQAGVDLGTETAPAGGNVVIDAVKGKSPQPGAVVAFRTRGKTEQNMIDALVEDDVVGNPFGPFAAIKTDDVGEAVTRFLNWLEGTGDTNVMQNYREYLLEIAPQLKGKTIFYYKDLGRPSHATALDYFLNGPKSYLFMSDIIQSEQPVQESTEIDQDIMDQLDSFDAAYTEGAVFKDTPNEVRYEALFNRINTPENKENLKKHALGSIKSLTTFMRAFGKTQQEAEEYMRKCFGLKF